jgi:hypothetical protein
MRFVHAFAHWGVRDERRACSAVGNCLICLGSLLFLSTPRDRNCVERLGLCPSDPIPTQVTCLLNHQTALDQDSGAVLLADPVRNE